MGVVPNNQASQPSIAPARPATSAARRARSRRRTVALALSALLIVLPLVAASWYAWNVVSAIDDAQDSAVVPLPTRSPQVAATPGDESPAQDGAPDSRKPSRFDIARGVFSTGTGSADPTDTWPDQDYLTILVLGVDTRAEDGDQNADTIILARINLKSHSVRAVSIPRDLLVEIPGHGEGKINGAYNLGIQANSSDKVAGVALLRDTIEHNFGTEIDDYVMVDFEGFQAVVDSVGGIEIDVPEAINDETFPSADGTTTFTLPAGMQHMDGETALMYARTRHGDSDDQRRERQILVVMALFQKGKQLGSIQHVAELISALGDAVQTSFGFDEQMTLAAIALDLDDRDVQMITMTQPLIKPGETDDGAWVYIGDPEAISEFIETSLSAK